MTQQFGTITAKLWEKGAQRRVYLSGDRRLYNAFIDLTTGALVNVQNYQIEKITGRQYNANDIIAAFQSRPSETRTCAVCHSAAAEMTSPHGMVCSGCYDRAEG